MNLEELSRNECIRAATLAHMVLSQSLPDERLELLAHPTAVPPTQRLRIGGLRIQALRAA